ncbi:D-tyrosyl-tRNA(Tyr) deacylase [Methanoplanus sp. FWC-SCC4]|uniref:D-aminoacyl-tRNA deacylase n=1 Tax=Methanochimaera problematica TaxID=2609417 RepID=A0AA97FBM0_9EURY|nr:D-aminoacyl-tRNA deacylase [Methanoplanus sp. FWC-SCC4]WOF15557.1 D-tyrosyl-tRNA(Tyr) deacylase [Methanoplanus sp. FWC-SCC4]
MLIAIVNSSIDPAGCNIRKHLLSKLGENGEVDVEYQSHRLRFYQTEGRLIFEKNLDSRTGADMIVFISRHTSQKPSPALTVHVTGNYGVAMLGGDDSALSKTSPGFMHAVLNAMSKRAPEGYRVSYEVTHHGPTDISVPSFFVEIGSTDAEWTNYSAGDAVAESLLEVLSSENPDSINLVGFGGNHYAARQTEISLNSRGAFGHIAHSREVGGLTPLLVSEMVQKSGAVAGYIDKKAVSKSELNNILKIADSLKLEILSEGEIKDLGETDWNSYLKIRKMAGNVTNVSKIHLHNLKGAGVPEIINIDPDLIGETLKTNENEFVLGIKSLEVVHLTSKTGQILPIFISYEGNKLPTINALITLCVKILHKEADTAVDGDHLIIRKIRFDPAKARELGVPKGPFFGKLAAGEEVCVDGRIINPSMVSDCSEKVIRVPGLENYL